MLLGWEGNLFWVLNETIRETSAVVQTPLGLSCAFGLRSQTLLLTVREIKQVSDHNTFLLSLGFKQLHDSEKYPTNSENKKK